MVTLSFAVRLVCTLSEGRARATAGLERLWPFCLYFLSLFQQEQLAKGLTFRRMSDPFGQGTVRSASIATCPIRLAL